MHSGARRLFHDASVELSAKGVTPIDIAALIVGLRILQSYLATDDREQSVIAVRRVRRNMKFSQAYRTAARVAQGATTSRDLRNETNTEDGIERLKTMIVVGFMLKIGDRKVHKRTWKPLLPLVENCFRLGSRADNIREGYEPSLDEDGRLMLLLGTLRRRVRYLKQISGGTLPVLKPRHIFREVDKALQSHFQ
jgi:hypothetical protein